MLNAMEEPMTIFFPGLFLPNEQQTLSGAACELDRGNVGVRVAGMASQNTEENSTRRPSPSRLLSAARIGMIVSVPKLEPGRSSQPVCL